jgi:replicative DNA helicase
MITIGDAIKKTMEQFDLQTASETKNGIFSVPSGFTELDDMIGGFHKQELVFIGARTGIEKTALALSMVKYMVVDRKIPVAYFSLERSHTEIGQSLLAQIAGVSHEKLCRGLLTSEEWGKLTDAASLLYDSPLYIANSPSLTIRDIAILARNMVDNNKVKVIFIDSLSLITPDVFQSLKLLVHELNLPVVVLSQLDQDFESVELNADTILLLHYEQGCEDELVIPATINVTKQQNGSTGEVHLVFLRQPSIFANRDERGWLF